MDRDRHTLKSVRLRFPENLVPLPFPNNQDAIMKKQIINHAKQCGEDECCGFVIDNKTYIPCNNISNDPKNHFEISPDDWIAAEERGTITAVVHSHPDGLPILSESDQVCQQQTAVDWWLVCDNQIHKFRYMQPLIGRAFKHGITDCYTLFRDAYHLSGIELPNFNREDDWWDNGQNLYLDNMESTGFHQIQSSEIQLGDVILLALMGEVVNHAAIYVGNNLILHQLPKRLSKRDLLDGYWLKHYHSVWRFKNWQQYKSGFTAILNNMALDTTLMQIQHLRR